MSVSIHAARARRCAGFTLIEVLMAAFIISLGVMGLLALFAGAAKQQQAATQRTRSVFFSNSATAVLAPALGRLEYPPTSGSSPIDGVWVPVMMDSRDHFLTLVDPAKGCLGSPFFLTPLPSDFPLLDPPAVPAARLGRAGFTDLQDRQQGPFAGMRPIPARNLDPPSLQFDVSVEPGGMSIRLTYNPSSRLHKRALGQYAYEAPGGMFGGGGLPDHVMVDVQPCTVPVNQRADAEIVAMNINLHPTEYISEVKLVQGQARRQELVSLNDRIVTRTDEASETGQRPAMSYSLLMRTSGTVTQVMVYTYSLTPPSGSATWVPPERSSDFNLGVNLRWSDKPPLRQAELDLRYDKGLNQYYFEADASNDLVQWALSPGQILLVQGLERLTSPLRLAGSDVPVKVVRRERRAGGSKVRAYLDRGPRSEGRSYLSGDDRENGIRRRLVVAGVSDVSQSIEDGSDWVLAAIDARVIQVVSGN